jgi:hypothetical protein
LKLGAEGYRHAHHAIARKLAEIGSPTDLVAAMDVGVIGYVSGLRVFDISGLTEPRVARAPGGFLSKRYPAASVLALEPRFVVLVYGQAGGRPRWGCWLDWQISQDPAFQGRYRLVMKRNHRFNWEPPQQYELYLFERTARQRILRP